MNIIKNILPHKLKRKVKENLGVPSLHWSLQNLKKAGFIPKFVIDGGAYIGEWTVEFLEVFPDVKVLMIEAQFAKENSLKEVCARYSNVQYQIALLGAKNNEELFFVEDETISHVKASSGNSEKKIATTLDTIIEKNNYEYPDFIKLDVQGYELEVLKGASGCLKNVQVCLLEVSIFDWGDRVVPLITEVLNFMDKHDFMVYDICHITRRPYDKALNQADLFFIRKDSKLVSVKKWA